MRPRFAIAALLVLAGCAGSGSDGPAATRRVGRPTTTTTGTPAPATTSTTMGTNTTGTPTSTTAATARSTTLAPRAPAPAAGCRVFPADNPWNTDVSAVPVNRRSDAYIASIGVGAHLHPDVGTRYGIPYVEIGAAQTRVPVSFDYADESDPGPYPIPPSAPVEGGSDRHVLVVDRQGCRLWELFDASTADGGRSWHAGSGATWDLRSNALRPDGWTSADAAGLPIFPGLLRYDEVAAGHIDHALHRPTNAAGVHPPRHPRRLVDHRSERAADGPAPADEGEL